MSFRWTSNRLAAIVLVGSWACGDEVTPFRRAENVAPVAKFSVADDIGRGDLVRFDATESRDPDGSIVSYGWKFGDESTTTASTAIAFHTYNQLGNFTVELEVTDNFGVTGTATKAVTVVNLPSNQPPTAIIDAPTSAAPGTPVTFDGSMSFDPDGGIANYEWTLGAGGPMTMGLQVSHTFTQTGSHDVVLTVTDTRGARATATHTIQIGTGNLPPVANAGADQTVGIGATVNFDGSASFDPDGQVVSYDWDFGDGTMGTGVSVTHVYNTASTFPVTLKVTDDGGLESTDTVNITVGQASYDGTYTMEANPSTGTCSGLPATFVATTVTFTSTGAMTLHADQPDPEFPNNPPVRMTGTITGPSFSVTGPWTDSQGADHVMTLTGTFSGRQYTGILQESVTFSGIPLCTIDWNVSGERL